MAVNRGKQFEDVVREAFEKVEGVSIDRLHDQTNGFRGSQNICDFIVYKYPHQYYIECKSVHGNTLSIHSIPKPDKHGQLHGFYGNITDTQWEGLSAKSKIDGVRAGVLCWWVDKDVTLYIPIQVLEAMRNLMCKSVRYDYDKGVIDIDRYETYRPIPVLGKKKRVFFDYDMKELLKNLEE